MWLDMPFRIHTERLCVKKGLEYVLQIYNHSRLIVITERERERENLISM